MSWIAELLERGRQRFADRTAVVDGDRRVTYAELDQRTNGLAAAFLQMGVERGHRVLVISHNRLEVLETYFALGRLGAAAVPVHYGAVPDEVATIVRECGIATIVGEEDLVDKVGQGLGCSVLPYESSAYRDAVSRQSSAPGDVPDDELLFILRTSATTGQPKGVCIDHRSLRSVTLGYSAEVSPDHDVVLLHCGPLSHGAMVLPLIYLASGATVVLMRMFTPRECLATMSAAGVTHLFVVPEMVRFLLQTRAVSRSRLVSLREIIYAAAPMPRPLLLDARAAFGCRFRQIYGLTEGGGPIAVLPPSAHDYAPGDIDGPAASVGRPIMGTLIRSDDDLEHPSPTGRVGELWVRGPSVMRGYWGDPAATAETMRAGWVRTGDLGTVDERGYVYLTGRVKDVIIRAGQKIFPAEVERVLQRHPDVRDACVVGIPSDDWGEVPFAYVVAQDSTPTFVAALQQLAREQLAVYKRPVGFKVVAELPRNAAGKVTRRHLRAQVIGHEDQLADLSS
jgi:acyl-CoA synthetase (AMP-forming)/AMP-acid ligase II